LFNVATGNYTNNDVRALQTTPLIGNLYGFSAVLNSMKHDRKKPKSEEPTEQLTAPELALQALKEYEKRPESVEPTKQRTAAELALQALKDYENRPY
jgi:hypothetical protein